LEKTEPGSADKILDYSKEKKSVTVGQEELERNQSRKKRGGNKKGEEELSKAAQSSLTKRDRDGKRGRCGIRNWIKGAEARISL